MISVRAARQAAVVRLTQWSQRRHGRDSLPLTVNRRRIYIIPSRFGATLALLISAMLLAGLNYNSNLGLAFGFLLVSLALVAMHHCHRNLLGLGVDGGTEADAFAGGTAHLEFALRNTARIERGEIEIRCANHAATCRVPAGGYTQAAIDVPVARRGVQRIERFELRTRHPFGWFRAWTYVQSPITLYAAPQPHGAHLPAAAGGNDSRAAHPDAPGDEDFSGLRAYAAGVPLKHMAWKVLARGGAPAVRSYSGTAGQPQWLDWASLPHLDTEARLSQLCRWVQDCESMQRTYGLKVPGVEILPSRGSAHRSACLRALAAYPAESAR